MVSKATKLRELFYSGSVNVLMEAHNGLSAKLAEEAGFEALWGSGLSISAALGVRDNNEASWTQVLEVLEFMNDATSLPILMDGDTGFGNFNNVRRLVGKLEQRGIAGVCLEDKLFPKTNSFIDGERQQLAEIDEFCGKVRAAKECQRDPDFMVVGRTEAFIAGWGLREALLRASAYAECGADAILVHSKRKDSREILEFMDHWKSPVPIVIVPTKYPTEPIDGFVRRGIRNFIFANQSLRSVINALKVRLSMLARTRDLMSIESEIASVEEVFRLQNVQELKASERRYLPVSAANKPRALVLGASKGELGALVADRPKCMLPFDGRPILAWHAEAFHRQGIREVAVVRGYKKEAVNLTGFKCFDNDAHAQTGELASLCSARSYLTGDVLIAYGDVLFDDTILHNLLTQTDPVSIAADASWRFQDRNDSRRDLVATSGIASPFGSSKCVLAAMGPDASTSRVTGEFIGLVLLRARGTSMACEILDQMGKDEPETLRTANLDELFRRFARHGQPVSVVHTFGHWRDIDAESDLAVESARGGI
ncbi:MAG: phosphoenolpyruvate mutase [Deltaproteobacteria bacterium]|nr:phosphoenolpyruvate mutase [Deltaproteobacteria bacterium]